MGLLFDLAVVAVALLVGGSLAVLAWTVAVGGTAAVSRGRGVIADARATVAATEAGLEATTRLEGDGPTA